MFLASRLLLSCSECNLANQVLFQCFMLAIQGMEKKDDWPIFMGWCVVIIYGGDMVFDFIDCAGEGGWFSEAGDKDGLKGTQFGSYPSLVGFLLYVFPCFLCCLLSFNTVYQGSVNQLTQCTNNSFIFIQPQFIFGSIGRCLCVVTLDQALKAILLQSHPTFPGPIWPVPICELSNACFLEFELGHGVLFDVHFCSIWQFRV